MTSALARRLDRLEAARRARTPLRCLILCGTSEQNEADTLRAFAEGRISAREPIIRVNWPAGYMPATQGAA